MPASAVAPLFPGDQETVPAAIEAEISVLGACLIDPEAIGRAVEIVDEGMFYREGHRRAFRSMVRLFERGDLVDPTTVAEDLNKAGELDQAGGLHYLAELIEVTATSGALEYHAKIVADRHRHRLLIDTVNAIAIDSRQSERSVDELIDSAEHRILSLGQSTQRAEIVPLRMAMKSAFARIEKVQASDGGLTGTPTGYADLDDATGGFQPGSLTILAARPSMGKTALVVGSAIAAAQAGKPVAIFSYEMSKEEIVQRMLCIEGLVDLGRLMRGKLEDDEFQRMATAARVIDPLPIWIDDPGIGRARDIRARARRLKVEQGDLGLIVIDYLQLIEGTGRENRQQDVTEISRSLKQLARELDVPVVALSQLSRAPEQRSDHRPILSDLRESGAIEQDADVVAFLYRPDYYDDDPELEGKAELLIRKQRNGPTPTIDLFFRKESARFEDVTKWGNR